MGKRTTAVMLAMVFACLYGCGPSFEECRAAGGDFYQNMLGDSRCMKKGAKP